MRRNWIWVGLVALILTVNNSTRADDIAITEFEGNGLLRFSVPHAQGSVKIEWAPKLDGNWFDTWQTLNNIAVTNTNMVVRVPMYYRVTQVRYSALSNDMVCVPYDPADKAVYLADTNTYPWGFNTYQKKGPEYTYYMSRFEVSNEEFVRFLNDAQVNQSNARGTNMYFAGNGDIYMSSNQTPELILFKVYGSRIIYNPASPPGSRYLVDPATPRGGGTYENHPLVNVSWYGAVKYCNWLTMWTGRGEMERCYTEGISPSNWMPVTATSWNAGYFNEAERADWLAKRGFRLPMDSFSNVHAFNEFYKASAWNGTTNVLYGFGRSTYDTHDANYDTSGDFYEGDAPETTPVGWYDGTTHDKYGELFMTRPNQNKYNIYDLSCNADEWSSDFSSEGNSSYRRQRGGCWFSHHPEANSYNTTGFAVYETSGYRGFRVVATYR